MRRGIHSCRDGVATAHRLGLHARERLGREGIRRCARAELPALALACREEGAPSGRVEARRGTPGCSGVLGVLGGTRRGSRREHSQGVLGVLKGVLTGVLAGGTRRGYSPHRPVLRLDLEVETRKLHAPPTRVYTRVYVCVYVQT